MNRVKIMSIVNYEPGELAELYSSDWECIEAALYRDEVPRGARVEALRPSGGQKITAQPYGRVVYMLTGQAGNPYGLGYSVRGAIADAFLNGWLE